MTWRSRSLRVLPIAFLLLLPPDGAWARGRGYAHGHHHDHPPAARGPPAERPPTVESG